MKQWTAWMMTAVLFFSLFSGVTCFAAAEELPTPLFWLDTDGGELQSSNTVQCTPLIDLTPAKIDDEHGYGIRLTGDWQGVMASGTFLNDLPEGEGVCLLVEYYITAPAQGNQLFRVMPSGNVNAAGEDTATEQWIDYFVRGFDGDGRGNDKAVVGQRSVLVYSYTAAQIAALRGRVFTIGVRGCAGGTDCVYIQSVKLVRAAHVAVADRGVAFVDKTAQPISDYYPDVTDAVNVNMTRRVLENTAEFAGYAYYKVFGNPAASSRTENKLLYIRMYAAEGHENDTVYIDRYEASTNGVESTWHTHVGAPDVEVSMTDGVGGAFVMGCFNNSLNGSGSFRLRMSEDEKIARVEVYDAEHYCVMPYATDAMRAQFHEHMVSATVGVTVYMTGTQKTVVCKSCGETLEQREIPLPEPYAWLDTSGGTLVSNRTVAASGEYGNVTPTRIPDTEQYGLRLDYDWSGFYVSGEMLKDVPEGQSVTMVIEYYSTKEFTSLENHQMFRYIVADGYPHTDLFVTADHLLSRETGLVFHTFTAEEMADLKTKDFRFYVLGCPGGVEEVYIRSMRLVNTEYVHAVDTSDRGYAFVDFRGQVQCDYYPDCVYAYGHNTTWDVYEQDGAFQGFMYVSVYGKAAGDEQNRNKPILLKFYANEGYENSAFRVDAVDVSDETGAYVWGQVPTLQFSNGVASVMVNACLKNRLNGVGAIRWYVRDAEPIARMEIYDVETYCTEPIADAAKAEIHTRMLEHVVNITVTGRVEPTDTEDGYTGDVYCATCQAKIADGKRIPALLQYGLPAPYAWFDATDGEIYGSDMLYPSGMELVAKRIDDVNGYGICPTGDWLGFYMNGDFFKDLPTGESATLLVEYYVADGWLNNQIFRIMPSSNVLEDGSTIEGERWIDCFLEGTNANGLNVVKTNETALVTYTYTAAQIEALRGRAFSVGVRGCPGGVNCTYIKSLRLVNSRYVWEVGGMDRLDYEESPQSGYYPHITMQKNSGVKPVIVIDGITLEGELNRYMYAELTYSLLREEEETCPVAVRFTFREDSNITGFDWQYQTARVDGDAFTAPFASVHSTVTNGVAEALLSDAAFTNGIHSTGSFRVPNTDSNPVWDSLLRVEVSRVHDRTALTARIEAAADVLYGTLPASRATYEAVLREVTAVANDPFSSERAIADAAVRLDAAAATLMPCAHAEGTELVGYRAETCEEAGYTGDLACRTCGFVAADGRGEVIPAHEVITQNQKAPTCKEEGYTGDRYCVTCQTVLQRGEAIALLPHPWDEGRVTRPATVTEDGVRTFTCTACGETRTESFTLDMVPGDVNGDRKVDSTDARIILQYAVGKIEETALATAAADVNGSGTVDSTDARLVLQYAVGKIQTFA